MPGVGWATAVFLKLREPIIYLPLSHDQLLFVNRLPRKTRIPCKASELCLYIIRVSGLNIISLTAVFVKPRTPLHFRKPLCPAYTGRQTRGGVQCGFSLRGPCPCSAEALESRPGMSNGLPSEPHRLAGNPPGATPRTLARECSCKEWRSVWPRRCSKEGTRYNCCGMTIVIY